MQKYAHGSITPLRVHSIKVCFESVINGRANVLSSYLSTRAHSAGPGTKRFDFSRNPIFGHFSFLGAEIRNQRAGISGNIFELYLFDLKFFQIVFFSIFRKPHCGVFQPLWWLPSSCACPNLWEASELVLFRPKKVTSSVFLFGSPVAKQIKFFKCSKANG